MHKIVKIEEKNWQGKKFWDVYLADGTKGSCWQPEFSTYKEGDAVDFTIKQNSKGYFTFFLKNVPKAAGGRGRSPEELHQSAIMMCLSYGKDMAVAASNLGFGNESGEQFGATMTYYADVAYTWYKKRMGEK